MVNMMLKYTHKSGGKVSKKDKLVVHVSACFPSKALTLSCQRQIYLFIAKIALFQRRGWGIKVDATVYVMMILVNELHIF